MATVTVEPERAGGDTNLVRTRTDASGNMVLTGADGLSKSLFDAGEKNNSVMFIGDSLSQAGNDARHPNMAQTKTYFSITVSLANINAEGTFVRTIRAHPNCPTGNGTLRYYKATDTFSWQAFGDTEGVQVSAAVGGFIALESGSASKTLYLACINQLKPAADASDTVNITGTRRFCKTNPVSFTGLVAMRFDTVYNFSIGGIKAAEWWAARSQWEDIATDKTIIHIGTNDVSTLATADAAIADVENIIRSRLAVGSEVIVGTLLPRNSVADSVLRAIQSFNRQLVSLCASLYGVTVFDAYPYLAAQGAGSYRTDNVTSDGLHLTAKGSWIVYKNTIKPILDKKMPDFLALSNPNILYHATEAPYGNRTAVGGMAGVAGTKGARVTGELATGWSALCEAGSVMACVASKVARTDGALGDVQRMALDNTGGVANEKLTLYLTSNISTFTAGDYVDLEFEGYLSGENASGLKVEGVCAGSSQSVYAFACIDKEPFYDLNGDTAHIVAHSGPVLIESGLTTVAVYIAMFMPAAGTATLDVVGVTMRKVPAPV